MITINLSAPKYTAYGNVIRKLMYSGDGNIQKTFCGLFLHGCPDNGNQHTLWLKGPKQDIIAFLDMTHEDFVVKGVDTPLKMISSHLSNNSGDRFNALSIIEMYSPLSDFLEHT